MKIGTQNNTNNGDVYNIETVNNTITTKHVDLASYLVCEKIIHEDSVVKCVKESLIITIPSVVAFLADISNIFPGFDIPWLVWISGFIIAFLYLNEKYGDAFGISISNKIQVRGEGKLVLKKGDQYSLNKSKAPCIYPNCPGHIYPINTPNNYDGPYRIMGECTHAGLQHGYVIDDNLQAYPENIFEEFKPKPDINSNRPYNT